MVNYLAVMLIDLVIAMALLVLFFAKYMRDDPRPLGPGFLISGFIGTVTALHMVYTQPLPSVYNVAFGEAMLLFGVLQFVAGLAMLKEWDLTSVAVVALFAGIMAIVDGIAHFSFGLTRSPALTGIGFILTGAVGVLFLPAYLTREKPVIRMVTAAVALVAFVIWLITAYPAFFGHLTPEG